MKQDSQSRTEWARVRHESIADAPIPFDHEDRSEGLYDPNVPAEVEQVLGSARLVRPRRGTQRAPVKKLVSLRLSQDVVAFYRARGKGWQTAIDETLRRSMRDS